MVWQIVGALEEVIDTDVPQLTVLLVDTGFPALTVVTDEPQLTLLLVDSTLSALAVVGGFVDTDDTEEPQPTPLLDG